MRSNPNATDTVAEVSQSPQGRNRMAGQNGPDAGRPEELAPPAKNYGCAPIAEAQATIDGPAYSYTNSVAYLSVYLSLIYRSYTHSPQQL